MRHERCLFVQKGSMATRQRSHDESPKALEARDHYIRNLMLADAKERYARLAEPFV